MKLSSSSIEIKIYEILKKTYPNVILSEDQFEFNLFEFGLDSLGWVQYIIAIEDDLDVIFPDDLLSPEKLYSIKTISQSIIHQFE